MLDCTDADKLITNTADEKRYFVRLVQLTQWALDCLNQIKHESRKGFPQKQEQILFDSIWVEVYKVQNDLIQVAIQDFKFIGVTLRDYKVGGNVDFHKFLVECLLSSYKSISNKMKKSMKKSFTEKFNDFLQPDIQKELDRHLDSSNKAKIDSYLNIRRDGDSLYTIYYTIESAKEIFEVKDGGNSLQYIPCIEDKRLVFQRVSHVTGEYLKDTPSTPNLLPAVRQSLDKKGVPTKALSQFRDRLAHYQIFPLIEGNDNEVKELFYKYFLPIREDIKSTIFETEDSFIQKILEEKRKEEGEKSKIDKSVMEELIEFKNRKGVQELYDYITIMQSKDEYRSKNDETKQFVDEVYETVQRMKSMNLPVVPVKSSESILSEKKSKPSYSFVEYINKSKLETYNKLRDAIAPVLERYESGLEDRHNDVLKITEVIDRLSYKDTSSPENSILDNFLSLPILENIKVKIKKDTDNKEIIESSLKKELERYFDAKSFKNNDAYVKFNDSKRKSLIDLLNSNISGTNANKEKLIRFFERSKENYITPEEYARLVEGLNIKEYYLKEKLLACSVEWRKKKCVDLLKKNPPALKTIYDTILEGKSIRLLVYEKFVNEFGLGEKFENEVKSRVEHINREIGELYSRRVQEESRVLAKVNNPYAVESQYINVYSLRERARDIKEETEENKGGKENKRGEKHEAELKKFRNFESHGNALLNIEEHDIISDQLVTLKNDPVVIGILTDLTSNYDKFQAVMDAIESHISMKKIIGYICPLDQFGRSTRSANKSCLTWKEIDKFDKRGAKNRDPDNIIIDSEKFISSISSEFETNREKFSKFVALASVSEVIGDHKNKVYMLTNKHKYLSHLERVGKVSGRAMHGIMAKTLVVDILRGDYKDLALNVGFLIANPLLEKVADVTSMKGAGYLIKGKAWRSRSLRIASPFISSALSVVTVYDLVNEVKKYRKGDKDALVNIIGNSMELVTDAGIIVVEIGESFGLWKGFAPFTGPVGVTVGALVFVGTGVYKAARAVEKTEEHVHLSGWQKFTEGSLAFFGLRQSDYIEELFGEKEGNNQAVENATCFLKDHPEIQRYVFPSVKGYTETWCPGLLYSDICEELKIITNTRTRTILDNIVFLDRKRQSIGWSSTRPDDVEGIDFFCLPTGNSKPIPEGKSYYCDGAIGVEYTNDRTGNDTLISLGDGFDVIKGFERSSNIFLFGDGHKNMFGGNEDDTFIFGGKSVNAINDSKIGGSIDGKGGIDTIDVGELAPHYERSKGIGRYQVSADLRKGILKDTSQVTLRIYNINVFLGRKGGVDQVVSACDTKHVDGRGGENKNYLDSVIIPKDDTCSYDTKVTVNPYTKVTNNATRGKFLYIVKGEKGKEAYIELGPSSQSTNTFIFNYTLKDVAAINKSEKSVTFSFVEEFYKRENKIDVNNSFNLTVSDADKNTTTYYLNDRTKIEISQNIVFAMQNTEQPIDSLVKDYSFIADKSQMYIVVYSKGEVLTVGNSHWEVFMNDPNARTSHLVGGSGENIFVITSGHQKLTRGKLSISDVVIYDFDQENKTYILNLHAIKEQLKKDIDREINTDVSKFHTDLLINVSLDDASKEVVLKIRLKGALENNWYKRVHIVLDNIFVIKEILGDFELTLKPLIFDDNTITTYVINPTDVAKGGKIRIKKEIGDYIFARDNDALVITNALNPGANENNLSTIILNEFYHVKNQNKMWNLKIEFNNKRILLRQQMQSITSMSTEKYSELKWEVTNDSYKAVMDEIKEQELFEAIERNNIGVVRELIDHGVSIDTRNNDGQTPLHFAAKSGKLEVVKYLIEEKHADVNVKDNSEKLPLHYAVISGNLEVVKYLIEEKGAYVNAQDGFRTVPLHLAAEYKRIEVLKYLIEEKGADVDASDRSGKVALHLAASNGNLEVVRYLIEEKGADIDVKDYTGNVPLLNAVISGTLEVVKYLIEEKGADVNSKDGFRRVPLHLAAEYNRLEVGKYLIEEKSADVDVRDRFKKVPLHYAAMGGSLEMVKYLKEEKGADVNVKDNLGQLPLHLAANAGRLDIVKYLIEEKGGDVNVKGNSGKLPLHYAVISGNLEVVIYLIEETGADVNAKDHILRVPLHYGVINGNLEVVKYLIEKKGADVNARDYSGKVHLHLAASNGNLEVVRYLIEETGTDINVMDHSGYVPLYLAVSDGRVDVVKYLVGKGANVNLRYHTGVRPQHDCRNIAMVKSFIEKGAWIDFKINGKTTLDILEREGRCQDMVTSIENILTMRLFNAIVHGDLDDVQDLINQGVDVNVKNSAGQRLLHFAASNGRLKVVKYIIEKKYTDVNVKDYYGTTPLHSAAIHGRLEIVKYLVEKNGADVNAKDDNGLMPLDLAVSKRYSDIVEYLERKLNEKREKPRRHKRSHQPELATSNASETSSWINDLVGPIVKLQESSAPSDAASSNRTVRHQRRNRHNDHSRHEDGMRIHRVRHRHRRVQKRNVKYQDSHYYIDQPQIATSSGTRPSSWISGLLDWIKEKGDGLVSSVANKFAAKESEVSKSRGNHACSVRLEKMYSATIPNIPQSRKSQGVPKGNIRNTSWSGWSSSWEKVTSNVTDAPEMNITVLNNALILGDLAVRLVNGTRHKQPIHENLLSPREKSLRFIDENMIMWTIQQGNEKFGGLDFS